MPTLPLTSRIYLLLFDFGRHDVVVDDQFTLIRHSLIFFIDGFELLRQTRPLHLVSALPDSNGIERRYLIVGAHLEGWRRQGGDR